MTDDAFVGAVEEAAEGRPRPGFRFGHREHLRLAWLNLERLGPEFGSERTVEQLRRLDAVHGGGHYHETITRFHLGLVAHAQARFSGRSFDEVAAEHPRLLDGGLLRRHYSRGLVAAPASRLEHIPPDLEPVPWQA